MADGGCAIVLLWLECGVGYQHGTYRSLIRDAKHSAVRHPMTSERTQAGGPADWQLCRQLLEICRPAVQPEAEICLPAWRPAPTIKSSDRAAARAAMRYIIMYSVPYVLCMVRCAVRWLVPSVCELGCRLRNRV
jgi:hypothetical protein